MQNFSSIDWMYEELWSIKILRILRKFYGCRKFHKSTDWRTHERLNSHMRSYTCIFGSIIDLISAKIWIIVMNSYMWTYVESKYIRTFVCTLLCRKSYPTKSTQLLQGTLAPDYTYVRTYVCTYIHAFVCSFLRSWTENKHGRRISVDRE